MKKFFLLILSICLPICGTIFDASAAVKDQFEKNDTKETAADITNMIGPQQNDYDKWFGINITAEIGSKKDVDWYKIKVNPNKNYRLFCDVINPDENATIYREYMVISDDPKANNEESAENIFCGLGSGEAAIEYSGAENIYFKVLPQVEDEALNGAESEADGNYILVVKIEEADKLEADSYEPNDSFATAVKVEYTDGAADIEANFNTWEDEDYYYLELPEGHAYKVTVTTESPDFNPEKSEATPQIRLVYVANDGQTQDGGTVKFGGSAEENSNVFQMDDGGKYYIECAPVRFGGIFPYKIHVKVE